ncbi:MAG: ABC transporter ATP-binding protein [Bacteroidia bacterium]|nr:ABC transporter ATP-binding protein [Bacteroidia bacterium]
MIRLINIQKSYPVGKDKLHVLKGINMQVQKGEMVSIMGASGSGKSTLLNILGILDNYDSGEYFIEDTLIKNLSEKKAANYRNRFIGFVFQSYNLLSYKSALENVALPLYYQGVRSKERNKKALDYLERVGIAEWARHLPSELSGGQKQRVAIARALIAQPKMILADEPTGNLDSKSSQDIMDLFKLIHKQGVTIIIITHEKDIAEQTERIITIKDGLITNS